MDFVLQKVIIEYTSILKTNLSLEEKNVKIKELSFILHNELYSLFVKEMSEDLLEQYEYFIKTADKFLSKVNPEHIKIFEENQIRMISFNGLKKPLLSAYEISLAFLDNPTKEQLFLFTIFLSNEEDVLKMNLVS